MKRRRCNICCCEVYRDEPGSYCQDCRGVLGREDDAGQSAYHEQYAIEHEARIQEHMKRVEECQRKRASQAFR